MEGGAAVSFSAKAVGAVGTLKSTVGAFIKTFRMKSKGNFPKGKNDNCSCAKAPGKESRNKNKGREHHHVVPVKNAAGGAAAVLHKPNTEGAPEKNTDKVTNIKSNGENKQKVASDYSGKIKCANHGNKCKPCKTDFDGIQIAFFDVIHKVLKLFDMFYFAGTKILKAELGGTDGEEFSAGEDLKKHIHKPNCPKEMENGKFLKEVHAAHNVKFFRCKEEKHHSCNKNKTAEKEFCFVYFSEF